MHLGGPGVHGEVGTRVREDGVGDVRRIPVGAVEGVRAGGAVGDAEDDEGAPRRAVGEAGRRLDQHVHDLGRGIAGGGVRRILLEVEDGGLQIVRGRALPDALQRIRDDIGQRPLPTHGSVLRFSAGLSARPAGRA